MVIAAPFTQPSGSIESAGVPLRILVVDADSETQQLASGVATDVQLTVCSASTVAAARRSLEQTPADIVLLDVALPNESSLTLLDEIA